MDSTSRRSSLLRLSEFCAHDTDADDKRRRRRRRFRKLQHQDSYPAQQDHESNTFQSFINDGTNQYYAGCDDVTVKTSNDRTGAGALDLSSHPPSTTPSPTPLSTNITTNLICSNNQQEENNCIRVSISILHSLPYHDICPSSNNNNDGEINFKSQSTSSTFSNNTTSENHLNKHKNDKRVNDDYLYSTNSGNDVFATVYTNDIDLLFSMQVFDGHICKLIHRYHPSSATTAFSGLSSPYTANIKDTIPSASTTPTYITEWVPVIVKYLPKELYNHYSIDNYTTGSSSTTKNNDNSDTTKSLYSLYIPPTVAASIGVYDCLPPSPIQDYFFLSPYRHHNPLHDDNITNITTTTSNISMSIPVATEASLIEIGSHPTVNGMPTFSLFSDLCLATDNSASTTPTDNTTSRGTTKGGGINHPPPSTTRTSKTSDEVQNQLYEEESSLHSKEDRDRKRLVYEEREREGQQHVNSLQRYFYESTAKSPTMYADHENDDDDNRMNAKREVRRLASQGSLISILLDHNDSYELDYCNWNNTSMKQMDISSWNSNVRLYQIMSAKIDDSAIDGMLDTPQSGYVNNDTESSIHTYVSPTNTNCFWISPKTKLVLLSTEDNQSQQYDSIQRLPQKSIIKTFHLSTTNNRISKHSPPNALVSTKTIYSEELKESANRNNHPLRQISSFRHPNLNQVVHGLLLLGNSNGRVYDLGNRSALSSHTLHLIGKEENNIQDCLSTAADIIGMNIIHIDGLAAFAHRYQTMHSTNASKQQSMNISGSISEKLSAIRIIFSIARRSTPCIIHLSNFHQELSYFQDMDMCHDEEGRFITCMNEEMLESIIGNCEHNANCRRHSTISSCCWSVPKVVLVLSTNHEFLKNGPIRLTLMSQSIQIDSPDERYAQSLWSNDQIFQLVKNNIMGASAREIEYFSQEMDDCVSLNEQESKADVSENEVLLALKQLQKNIPACFREQSRDSKASIPKVNWEDIGGLRHVRNEVMDAIELPLQYPDMFKGSKRSGILLFGPPGNGKTLVAKAVATECNVPFLSVRGPELLGSYVGESEGNIRAAFDSARKAAAECKNRTKDHLGAAILFFDEIDSLAPRRGGVGDGGGVMERVVATILGELDKEADSSNGGDTNTTVFIISATNRPDLLDPSLLSPGRFDRLVYLGLAQSRIDRMHILAAQTRKFRFEGGVESMKMADMVIDRMPDCLSGADFSAIASGAMTKALRRLCDEVDKQLLEMKDTCDDIDEDKVLNDWEEENLQPTVTKEDLISAAKEIVPSIDKKSLEKYESLRKQFCLSTD